MDPLKQCLRDLAKNVILSTKRGKQIKTSRLRYQGTDMGETKPILGEQDRTRLRGTQ